jgi:hypothetical protein
VGRGSATRIGIDPVDQELETRGTVYTQIVTTHYSTNAAPRERRSAVIRIHMLMEIKKGNKWKILGA